MSEGAGRLRTRWRDSRGIFGSDKGMVQGGGGGVPGGVGAATSKSERKYQISEYDISVSSSNLG